jgi:hypothetical protein
MEEKIEIIRQNEFIISKEQLPILLKYIEDNRINLCYQLSQICMRESDEIPISLRNTAWGIGRR